MTKKYPEKKYRMKRYPENAASEFLDRFSQTFLTDNVMFMCALLGNVGGETATSSDYCY